MQVARSKGTNGEDLVTVTFERVSPDSRAPIIETIFLVEYPSGLGRTVAVVVPMSTTRTDTRQVVTLTPDEFLQVCREAAEYVAEE